MILENSLLFLTITSFFLSPSYADFQTAKEHNRPVIQLMDTYSTHPYIIEEKNTHPIYDIPLSEELQKYVYEISLEYEIDHKLLLSIMWVETGGTFKLDLISKTNDYGLMQINKSNHKWLSNAGLDDMLDPYDNIRAGAIILGGLVEKYGNSHQALMAYNFGEGGMKKVMRNGHQSSRYSRRVFEIKKTLFNESLAFLETEIFYEKNSKLKFADKVKDPSIIDGSFTLSVVREMGLEPTHPKIHAPQTCLSADSSTLAYTGKAKSQFTREK